MQGSESAALSPLSCATCRLRKVKCDRRATGCSICARSGVPCEYPARKRTNRPRQGKNSELLRRLARLESIVSKVEPTAISNLDALDASDSHASQNVAAAAAASSATSPRPAAVEAVAMREKSEDIPSPASTATTGSTTKYLSAEFWSNLCGEVEGLKQTLEQSSDSDDDEEPADESTPESLGQSDGGSGSTTSHSMFGNYNFHTAAKLTHPSPEHTLFLFSAFCSNVEPVLKVVHRPTMRGLVEASAKSTGKPVLDPANEAVLFAIYFAAVVSLDARECLEHLGKERNVLVSDYRAAVEMALAKADYLNSSYLEVLQALAIYLSVLRADDGSRASWALLALAVRLAHAQGLHRDGDGAHLPFFVAEMRRRVWWALVVLDVRAVEDRGSEAIVSPESFNTVLLRSLDDDDFGPTTAVAPPERDGPSDVTFALCCAIASETYLSVADPHPRPGAPPAARLDRPPPAQTEFEVLARVRRLEERFAFASAAGPAHLPSALTAITVRLIVLKYWLTIQYPLHTQVGSSSSGGGGSGPSPRSGSGPDAAAARHHQHRPLVSREHVLHTAVAVMELTEHACTAWRPTLWWMRTYVQWHPLAVALAELCVQTRGPLVGRAWAVIDRMYAVWGEGVADTRRGGLWRPVRKLMKKARAARVGAQMGGLNVSDESPARPLPVPVPVPPTAMDTTAEGGGDGGAAGQTAPDGGNSRAVQQTRLPEKFGPSRAAGHTDLSAANFLFQQSNFFAHDFEMDMDMADITDWSDWNEFLNDTNLNPPFWEGE